LRRILALVGIDLLALALLFLAGEIGVRWHREGGFLPAIGSLFDRRAVPADPASRSTLIPDPDLGFRLNPAAPDMNSLGLRHPELARPKPPGVFRVLVVGDSVSWYQGGYVQLLRDALAARRDPLVEVINASTPGYTTHQESLLLARIADAVEPDVVIVQYCLNDNHRFLMLLAPEGGWLMTQEGRNALFPDGDGMLERFSRWSYLAFEIRKRLLAPAAPEGARRAWERDLHFKTAWQDSSWPDERATLLAMRDRARSGGASFLVLAVPWEPQLDPAVLAPERDVALKPQRMLADVCAEADVPLLDLAPAFEAHAGTRLYVDGIHLTREGHEIAAREILGRLEREGMLP
jgi:lysophospholipase L1-like esterase